MAPRVPRIVCTVALAYTLALLPEVCRAEDKPKPPDFSQYVFVTDTVGEIVKADNNSLTIRITWLQPQVKGNKGNKGNANRRPPLNGNNRNFQNPNNRRPPQITVKEEHHDYTIDFIPETQIRTKLLPPKTDDKGKTVPYTAKELQDLRGPWAFPGYTTTAADLVPGTIVEVYVVRDKSIAAEKVKDDDLRLKYAVILGRDPTPPKDITPKKDKKDKKDKN